MAMIFENELQSTLDKANYFTKESKQLTTNIEFYLNDLQNFYKTKNSKKINTLLSEINNTTRMNNINSENYCTVLTRTLTNYKLNAVTSAKSFKNINTGGQ